MAGRTDEGMSRRAFLLGGTGALTLAACGSSSEGGGATTAPGNGSSTTGPATDELVLVQYFANDSLRPGIEQRTTFGVADPAGILTAGAPDAIEVVLSLNGTAVGAPITVPKHANGIPRPYYPVRFTPPDPGIYEAVATIGDVTTRPAAFQVLAPESVTIPQVGEPMRPFDTPTVDDGRGVDPICTAEPACPLHEITLTAALAEGRPTALLISTPKYCQVAICGPVLDLLLATQSAFPQVRMLHAEVWPDAERVFKETTPVCGAYGLTFEPALFLAGADGAVFERFDTVYDATELEDALTRLIA